jgi:hypothetical protein
VYFVPTVTRKLSVSLCTFSCANYQESVDHGDDHHFIGELVLLNSCSESAGTTIQSSERTPALRDKIRGICLAFTATSAEEDKNIQSIDLDFPDTKQALSLRPVKKTTFRSALD